MIVEDCEIDGLKIITPKVFGDDRGYFFESYNNDNFKEFVCNTDFVQDNESLSSKHVIRGLHFQTPPFEQGKLVRVIKGAVMDIAVDIRTNSKTYGKVYSILLSEENKKQLWIPPGFAHGFETLEDNTVFSYKCTALYNKSAEGSIYWNDPSLAIKWQTQSPIISEKDTIQNNFKDFKSPF